MAWRQLEVHLGARDPAPCEALLENLGACSITLRDAGDHPLLEPLPGETPLWPEVILTALFTEDVDTTGVEAALADELGADHFERQHRGWTTLAEQDWQAGFEQSVKPRCFGRRLWVVPDAGAKVPDGAVSLVLRPGLAFGSGEHATTAMCLAWLDSLDLRGKRVLDYGCGSGILGLAAAALGASHVTLTDIDPQALTASRDNAAANGLAYRVYVESPAKIVDSVQFDVLVANILSNTLIDLGPHLNGFMRPGADMAITGILEAQAEQVVSAWAGWANMRVSDRIRDWVLLTGRKLGS